MNIIHHIKSSINHYMRLVREKLEDGRLEMENLRDKLTGMDRLRQENGKLDAMLETVLYWIQ